MTFFVPLLVTHFWQNAWEDFISERCQLQMMITIKNTHLEVLFFFIIHSSSKMYTKHKGSVLSIKFYCNFKWNNRQTKFCHMERRKGKTSVVFIWDSELMSLSLSLFFPSFYKRKKVTRRPSNPLFKRPFVWLSTNNLQRQ